MISRFPVIRIRGIGVIPVLVTSFHYALFWGIIISHSLSVSEMDLTCETCFLQPNSALFSRDGIHRFTAL
jgi:hypothetical protein